MSRILSPSHRISISVAHHSSRTGWDEKETKWDEKHEQPAETEKKEREPAATGTANPSISFTPQIPITRASTFPPTINTSTTPHHATTTIVSPPSPPPPSKSPPIPTTIHIPTTTIPYMNKVLWCLGISCIVVLLMIALLGASIGLLFHFLPSSSSISSASSSTSIIAIAHTTSLLTLLLYIITCYYLIRNVDVVYTQLYITPYDKKQHVNRKNENGKIKRNSAVELQSVAVIPDANSDVPIVNPLSLPVSLPMHTPRFISPFQSQEHTHQMLLRIQQYLIISFISLLISSYLFTSQMNSTVNTTHLWSYDGDIRTAMILMYLVLGITICLSCVYAYLIHAGFYHLSSVAQEQLQRPRHHKRNSSNPITPRDTKWYYKWQQSKHDLLLAHASLDQLHSEHDAEITSLRQHNEILEYKLTRAMKYIKERKRRARMQAGGIDSRDDKSSSNKLQRSPSKQHHLQRSPSKQPLQHSISQQQLYHIDEKEIHIDGEEENDNTAYAHHIAIITEAQEKLSKLQPQLGCQFVSASYSHPILPTPGGIRLTHIIPNTSASHAGLCINDIILTMDGEVVQNKKWFKSKVTSLPVGRPIHLQLIRASDLEHHTHLLSLPPTSTPTSPIPSHPPITSLDIMVGARDVSLEDVMIWYRMAHGIVRRDEIRQRHR